MSFTEGSKFTFSMKCAKDLIERLREGKKAENKKKKKKKKEMKEKNSCDRACNVLAHLNSRFHSAVLLFSIPAFNDWDEL